jgi:hypothetical protein
MKKLFCRGRENQILDQVIHQNLQQSLNQIDSEVREIVFGFKNEIVQTGLHGGGRQVIKLHDLFDSIINQVLLIWDQAGKAYGRQYFLLGNSTERLNQIFASFLQVIMEKFQDGIIAIKSSRQLINKDLQEFNSKCEAIKQKLRQEIARAHYLAKRWKFFRLLIVSGVLIIFLSAGRFILCSH